MKKDTTFSIRIASGDLAAIKQRAKQARMSQGEYVTRCCRGQQIVTENDLKDVLRQQAGQRESRQVATTSFTNYPVVRAGAA